MIRLELLGAHTRVHAGLCSRCPQGPAGCCASPPPVAWADLGRIASLGGAGWLLEQMQAGHLRPGPRGLLLRRVAPQPEDDGTSTARCTYHGPAGCTIPPDRRSATCNYYVCEDALTQGGEGEGNASALSGRRANDTLTALYGRWDLELGELIGARWPDGPPWDAVFLAWLGEEYGRRLRRSAGALRRLNPRP